MERGHVLKLVHQFLHESGMSVAAMAFADHVGEAMEGPFAPPSGSLLREFRVSGIVVRVCVWFFFKPACRGDLASELLENFVLNMETC